MLISIVIKPRKKLDTIRQRGVTSTSINEMKLENVELLLFFFPKSTKKGLVVAKQDEVF